MRSSLALISIIFFITFFSFESSGNWQNIGGDLAHTGYLESSPVTLELKWKYKVGNTDISAPIIDSGILFAGSDDSNLYAIDIMSGKLKWKYSALGKVYTPTAKNGMVFAASFDNYIYGLYYNGSLKWKYNTGSSISSPPVVYNNILYGGFDRYIYSIYTNNGTLKWKYLTDGLIESTPAISQGFIYVGSNDKNIYVIDIKNFNLIWKYPTDGGISSSPTVINGGVYVGSRDANVYAVDSSTGELKWKKRTSDEIKSSPAVFEDSVYIGSNDNMLYSLHIDNGNILWKFKTNDWVDSPPVLIRDMVYTGSKDGTIYVLDMATGTLLNKYTVGRGIISLALSDNMLFATSKDGYVYAFGAAPISEKQPVIPTVPRDTTPPVLKINPVPLNISSEKLTISGTAEDPSGILVVTVNGVDAGTANWIATLNLSKGQNTITIVAVDKAGNIKTERRVVTFIGDSVSRETPPAKIPGFYLFSGIVGFIIAMYTKRLYKK